MKARGYFRMYAYWVCAARETLIFSPKFPFRSIFSQMTKKSGPEHHHFTFFAIQETIIFKISLISTRSPPPTAGSARTIGGDPGGDGGDVSPPRIFLGGIVPPLDFWKLEKYLFIYLHFKHNESNTKRLIQHKNTTKHTNSLNLPRASRADSRPNHISASLALPVISVAGEGGRGAIPPPPPNNYFSEFCRYIWKFVAT